MDIPREASDLGGQACFRASREECHRCHRSYGVVFGLRGFGWRQRGHEDDCIRRSANIDLPRAPEFASAASRPSAEPADRPSATPTDWQTCHGGDSARTSAATQINDPRTSVGTQGPASSARVSAALSDVQEIPAAQSGNEGGRAAQGSSATMAVVQSMSSTASTATKVADRKSIGTEGKPCLYYSAMAGRGELTRLIAVAGALELDEAEVSTMTDKAAFGSPGSVPCLSHGQLKIAQSFAMETYVAEIAPAFAHLTPAQRAIDCMFCKIKDDVLAGFAKVLVSLKADEGKRATVADDLAKVADPWFEVLEQRLPSAGFVHGLALPTAADVVVLNMARGFLPFGAAYDIGKYDPSVKWPKFTAHAARVAKYPALEAYLERSKTIFADPYGFRPGTWSVSQSADLGTGPQPSLDALNEKSAKIMPSEEWSSVAQIVDALNSNSVFAPDGLCVVFSKNKLSYFLVWRSDKEADAKIIVESAVTAEDDEPLFIPPSPSQDTVDLDGLITASLKTVEAVVRKDSLSVSQRGSEAGGDSPAKDRLRQLDATSPVESAPPPPLSEETSDEARLIFEICDAEGAKQITLQIFADMSAKHRYVGDFVGMGEMTADAALGKIAEVSGKNTNDSVSWNEFERLVTQLRDGLGPRVRMSSEQLIDLIFESCEVLKNGEISLAEFAAFCIKRPFIAEAVGMKQKKDGKQKRIGQDQLFAQIDTDGSGQVTRQELRAFVWKQRANAVDAETEQKEEEPAEATVQQEETVSDSKAAQEPAPKQSPLASPASSHASDPAEVPASSFNSQTGQEAGGGKKKRNRRKK